MNHFEQYISEPTIISDTISFIVLSKISIWDNINHKLNNLLSETSFVVNI